ncbi:MAG TPA: hypothetical protein VNO86_01625 [Candidatus Binatia bacterium]|nr:hypothetical protein [Candidatus Binatia bacterium]
MSTSRAAARRGIGTSGPSDAASTAGVTPGGRRHRRAPAVLATCPERVDGQDGRAGPPGPVMESRLVGDASTRDTSGMTGLYRSGAVVLAAIIFAGGCVAPGAGRPASSEVGGAGPDAPASLATETPPRTETPAPSRPVDSSLTPVSRSNPSPEAQAAIELCGLDPTFVSGMAKVPKARDLPKYVRLTGKEPEIQVDEPAWVITYSGRVILPRALGWADDPICVVVDGVRTVFLSGRHGRGDLESAPLPIPDPPFALPTLAP